MSINPSTLRQVQKFNLSATARVLEAYHARVLRLARGISGRSTTARKIVNVVMRQAARSAHQWHHDDAPERWFLHHTLLACRRCIRHLPDVSEDELFTRAGSDDPAFRALVSALRQLPPQQQEAFLLGHAERLGDRLLAVAMDLSTTAATTHLSAADQTLAPLAGGRIDEFHKLIARAWHDGINPQVAESATIDRAIVRHVLPRRAWCIARPIFVLAVIAILGLFTYRLWGRIDW